MLRTKRYRTVQTRARPNGQGDPTLLDDLWQEAGNDPLRLVDEVRALPKPDIYLHAEKKFDELADEQLRLFEAEGFKHSEPYAAEAAALKPAADAQQKRIDQATTELKEANDRNETAQQALKARVTREGSDKFRYWAVIVLLLGGDIAGISNASISLGDIPWLAVIQALAVAVAMITVGTLGAELKISRLRRQRQKDPKEWTDEEKAFATHFTGADTGELIVKYVVIGGLVSVVMVGIGILSLRSATDGTGVGIVYGFLATAVALGSWANSYTHADDAAVTLESCERDVVRAAKRQRQEAEGGPLELYGRCIALVTSIKAEYAARGLAAKQRELAAKQKMLEVNPGVAGHGVRQASAGGSGKRSSTARNGARNGQRSNGKKRSPSRSTQSRSNGR